MNGVGHNTGQSVYQWFRFPQRPLGKCPLEIVQVYGKEKEKKAERSPNFQAGFFSLPHVFNF